MRGAPPSLAVLAALVLAALAALCVFPSISYAQDPEGSGPVATGGGAALAAPSTPASDAPTSGPSGEGAELEDLEVPRGALLDHRFGEARDGRSERVHAWASLGFFGGTIVPAQPIVSLATVLESGDAIVIAPSIGARLALTRELDVSFEWNAAYGAMSVRGRFDGEGDPEPFAGEREVFEPGNPVFQLAFSHDWSILSLQIGVGAAIPVAALEQAATDPTTASDRASSLLLYETMLAMHGAIDPWRFFSERLSFVLPVRIAVGDRLGGAVEVAGAWTIPVLGSQRDSQHEGALQVAGDLSYEIVPEVRIGVRGSVVAWRLARPDGPSRAQGALEPWVRATLGPVFGTLRATLDLGGDYGLGTSAGVWAIHLGGGASLDGPSSR